MAINAVTVIAILVVTWLIAMAVRWAVAKLVTRIPALQRTGSDGQTLGSSIGSIASLLVWLLGLVAVLQVFSLDQVLSPITSMLDTVLGYLPNLIGAAFVFFIGALIAKIVRQLIETSLATVDLGKIAGSASQRVAGATDLRGGPPSGQPAPPSGQPAPPQGQSAQGPSGGQGDGPSIGSTIATIVYALIMIVVAIAALQILGISSISRPAEQMLTTIFDALPSIVAAAIILGIGVVIARFAGDLLGQILSGVRVDKALREAEVLPEGSSAVPTITKIAQVAIVLFFSVMAAQMLGFPQITTFLSEVLALGGRVLFGGAIIAAGFYVAGLLARAITGIAGQVVRWATIILFAAMGLTYMGVADSIIELAFGSLVVGSAVAAALAFGLGGRETAARVLEKVESKARAARAAERPAAAGQAAQEDEPEQ
nr:mechanosensitive ion channel [Janibacter alkaliphilus]